MINNFLRHEDVEKGRVGTIHLLMQENSQLAAELDRLVKQELNLNREISDLSMDRELKVPLDSATFKFSSEMR